MIYCEYCTFSLLLCHLRVIICQFTCTHVLTSNIRCADWYVLSCRRVVDSGDDSILSHIISEFEQRVTELNTQKCDELRPHLHSAVDNVIQTVSYRFFADHCPKLGRVTNSEPLVHQ